MTTEPFHIIPYTEAYKDSVEQLEKSIVQGRAVQLEMIKQHYLDRAKVYDTYYSCLAVTEDHEVMGAATGARTYLIINDEKFPAGIVFDIKVRPDMQRQGIGQLMSRDIFRQFFQPQGLVKNFITAKLSNIQAYLLARRVASSVWRYGFVYLTIPTSRRILEPVQDTRAVQDFRVHLFDKHLLPEEYYKEFASGLGYFNTSRMYTLRIRKISWWVKASLVLLRLVRGERYLQLPAVQEEISFATLYQHSPQNMGSLDEVLEDLEVKGIRQLMVCCRKNDPVYMALRKISMYAYHYSLLTDFKVDQADTVGIDVRCL